MGTSRRLRSISRPSSLTRGPAGAGVGKDDDLSEDLPPLDGVSGDEEELDPEPNPGSGTSALDGDPETNSSADSDPNALSAFDDPLDDLEDGGDPFDDKANDAEPAFDDANDNATSPERGLLDDSDEAANLDIGDTDVEVGDETTAVLDDSVDPDSDDDNEDGSMLDESTSVGDGGEEGFGDDDDEDLREEDLPALDADEDGEVDERSLYEAPESVLDMDPTLPSDRAAWTFEPLTVAVEPAGEPVAVTGAFECVGIRGARRFIAGAELREVSPGAAQDAPIALPSPVAQLTLGPPGDAWLTTLDGALLKVANGAAHAVGTWPPRAHGAGAVDVAFASAALWVLDANDELWVTRDDAASWTREATHVLAMATDEAHLQLVVLALDRAGNMRELNITDPNDRSKVLPLTNLPLAAVPSTLPWRLAVRGTSKMVYAHGAGAWRSVDGQPWSRLLSSTETFAGTWLDDGSMLLAIGDLDGENEPVRLAHAEASGPLFLVAELLPGEELCADGEPILALSPAGWSDHGGALVVGPFGARILRRKAPGAEKRH